MAFNSVPFKIEGIHYATGNTVSIEIVDGKIAGINNLSGSASSNKNIYISPGLIDNQINGYANVDFSGNNLTAESVNSAVQSIWKDGVTTFLPTVITNSHENLIRNLKILDKAFTENGMAGDSVPGFHLEGPYISPEEGYRGCHPLQYIRKPSWSEFSEYQKASGGRIIQVTIAPETEGAQDFIRKCTDEGIVVAIGHTNATAEQIKTAVENGATLSTHLGNGAANFIHRHRNPIWPQLANERLTPTIIADGHHLLPEELSVFYKVKGVDNIILTSDVIYLIGMTPGNYSFLGMNVTLQDDGLVMNKELNCLAGASYPLKKGVENIMTSTGCSLTYAIKMASENVSRVYKLYDRGTLATGKKADIILFERDGNQINIKQVLKNGITVFKESA
jgi:N-acetylglucosamine-6-phosphate deacetylase